jgi:hypothetical protein
MLKDRRRRSADGYSRKIARPLIAHRAQPLHSLMDSVLI